MSDAASWVGIGIAGCSLAVSVWAVINSNRAQKAANAAQKRIVEIEEQRETDRVQQSKQAKIIPTIKKRNGNTTSYHLYLKNEGDASARNICLMIDNKPLAEHQAFCSSDTMPESIGQHSEISFPLALSRACNPPFEIRVTWDDDSGKDRVFKTTLTW
jgi:hypothetical protein